MTTDNLLEKVPSYSGKISMPIVLPLGSGWKFLWVEEDEWVYKAIISHLREDSHGHLQAELEIEDEFKGIILPMTQISLLSEASRTKIAKRLTDKNDLISWGELLEQICGITVKRFRTGQPSILLRDIPEKQIPRYRVEPLILEKEANSLWGDGDSGKSIFSCFLAVLVQHRVPWLGLQPLQGNCLYLDWETSEDTVKERCNAIRKGLGIPLPSSTENDIRYKYCARPVVDMVEEIQAELDTYKIDFVICDSVNKACAGEPERLEFAKQYYNALRSFKRTTLSIDHITRGSNGKSPFGSVEKKNAPRQGFYLKAKQDTDRHVLAMGLFHEKHNVVPKLKARGFKFEFLMNGQLLDEVRIDEYNIQLDPTLSKGLSQTQQIIAVLQEGALSVKDIAEALETTEGIVRVILNRNKRIFVKTIDGEWGLLSDAPIP